MFSLKKIIVILFMAVPIFCFSQTTLSSLSPSKFFTETDPSDYNIHTVTLYGIELWPMYMTAEQSIKYVKVYFKKGDKVGEISQKSGDHSSLAVNLSGPDWLQEPGSIEVYMMVDDWPLDGVMRKTNSLWISVATLPETPPVLTKISPNKILTGTGTSGTITVYGENLGNWRSTYSIIGGKSSGLGSMDAAAGYLSAWIPKEYINTPGVYDVQIKSKYGYSNIIPLVIEKPPLKMTKIVSKIFGKPTETKPATNTANPPIMVNASPNSGVVTTTPDSKAGELLADGIKVKMQGNIIYGEDRAVLEKFIDDLDNVLIVENQMKISDNNMNMLFEISGKGMEPSELERVKTNIEDKLKAMGFPNAVVIVK